MQENRKRKIYTEGCSENGFYNGNRKNLETKETALGHWPGERVLSLVLFINKLCDL